MPFKIEIVEALKLTMVSKMSRFDFIIIDFDNIDVHEIKYLLP